MASLLVVYICGGVAGCVTTRGPGYSHCWLVKANLCLFETLSPYSHLIVLFCVSLPRRHTATIPLAKSRQRGRSAAQRTGLAAAIGAAAAAHPGAVPQPAECRLCGSCGRPAGGQRCCRPVRHQRRPGAVHGTDTDAGAAVLQSAVGLLSGRAHPAAAGHAAAAAAAADAVTAARRRCAIVPGERWGFFAEKKTNKVWRRQRLT